MSVKEDIATIKAKLEAINERQENWFKLLQERIPKWDESVTHSNFLMRGFWTLSAAVVAAIGTAMAAMFSRR